MNLFQQLVQIILLRRRPQDIDYDQAAAGFYLVLTIGLSYITSAQSGFFSQPLLISVVQTCAQAGFLYLFLQLAGNAARFVQSSTALFGVTAILTGVTWVSAQIPVLQLFTLFLVIWSFYITILIMRVSFDASLMKAVLVALALGICSMFVTMLLVPSYVAEAQQIFVAQETAS